MSRIEFIVFIIDFTAAEELYCRYEQSVELKRSALADIPKATSSNVHGQSSYDPYPMIYMEEGEGAIMRDVDGNEYNDSLCGVSAIINGHAPDHQREAVKAQVDRGAYFATTYELEQEAARQLNELFEQRSHEAH
jgi:glutamate-1-semialdehyde aminotransferase